MAAVRLLLAAIVCSAAAPATAAMAEREAPCRWCCDGGPADLDAPLTLPGAVRAALAGAASQVTGAVWAAPTLPTPPRVAVREATRFAVAVSPPAAAVLPRAPKTSPPT